MRARPIGPADSDPIATACTVRGAAPFHRAPRVVVDQYRHVRIGTVPSELRALQVLWHFLLDVQFWAKERSGMSRFLLDPQHKLGVLAPEAAQFCASIGATRTAQHFARTFAEFPGGVLPPDYKGLVRSLAPMLSARPNPLVLIEREHGDTFTELTGALRTWLRANREHVAIAIAACVQEPARANAGATESSALVEILMRGGPPGSDAEYDVLDELAEWVWSTPGRRGLPFHEIPDGAQLIVLMESLARALGSGGGRYVVDWSVFDDFPALRRHAESIGAHVGEGGAAVRVLPGDAPASVLGSERTAHARDRGHGAGASRGRRPRGARRRSDAVRRPRRHRPRAG